MSDPFGTSPHAAQAPRAKRTLILSSLLAIAVTIVLGVLDLVWDWLVIVIVVFEIASTAFAVWAINRGTRAAQDESPLSKL